MLTVVGFPISTSKLLSSTCNYHLYGDLHPRVGLSQFIDFLLTICITLTPKGRELVPTARPAVALAALDQRVNWLLLRPACSPPLSPVNVLT